MKKLIVWCLLQLGACVSLHAQFSEPIYPVHRWEHRFVRYHYYLNVFDSVWVGMQIGEFRMQPKRSAATAWQPLYLQRIEEGKRISGDSSQGRDVLLEQYGSTTSFTVPSGGCTLSWWRDFQCSHPYTLASDVYTSLKAGDAEWYVGTGQMQDQTEFRVELRDDKNVVVAVIDSFGVMRNPSSPLAQRFGTAPDTAARSFSIPAKLAGRVLHCCIVPYRYGETPYGIELTQVGEGMLATQSALRYRVGSRTAYASNEQIAKIDSQYYSRMVEYYDSSLAASAKIPPLNSLRTMSSGLWRKFQERYFNVDTIGGKEIFQPKYQIDFSEIDRLKVESGQSKEALSQIRFQSAKMSSKQAHTIDVNVLSGRRESSIITIDIYDPVSRTVALSAAQRTVNYGANSLRLDVSSLENGRYTIRIRSERDQSWSYGTVEIKN